MATMTEKVRTRVVYGIGEACIGEVPLAHVQRETAREVILRVAEEPQTTDPARRTAQVLKEALRSRRPLYVERLDGAEGDAGSGEPVSLEEPLTSAERWPAQSPKTVELLMSEPYVGGVRR